MHGGPKLAGRPTLILSALLLAPLVLTAAELPVFRFDAPSGPRFAEAERQAQREAGAGVVPLSDTKLLDTIRDSGRLCVGDGLSCVYTDNWQ